MSGQPDEQGGLSEGEVRALYDTLWDTGCHGFVGDHPELVAAVERILAARLAAHPVPEPAQVGEVGAEWRVTGEPGEGYPSYHFVWSGEKAEDEARGFIRLHEDHGTDWNDGPHLHHRTVTRTPWEEV